MYEGTETIGNHASRKQIITVGPHSFILALLVYTVLHISTESAYGQSDYLLFKLNVYKSI